MKYNLTYTGYGERSILIEWPENINEDILIDIISFKESILNEFSNELRAVPAYNSLTLIFNDLNFRFSHKIEILKELYKHVEKKEMRSRKIWEIPVCYDLSFGIDLHEISKKKNCTVEEIVQLHTNTIYTVYCIGFLPGFMYLGGLPELLTTPRRNTPRLKVPAGAVGIGGNQTGIYPQESPGGWNIIGNSPIKLFDPHQETPCQVNVGDKIKFVPISLPQYKLIEIEIKAKVFSMKNKAVQ